MKRTDTKKRIMEEALRLFSENGYDAVSVEQIAQAVGIKAPSLYNHYKSKRAIFDGIVMESSRRYAEFVAHHFVHLEHGQDDLAAFRDISEDMLRRWEAHTEGAFTVSMFDGGHFYLNEFTEDVAELVNDL